ncbi:MAG: hypothetical protein ACWGPR_10820 [Candidatus Deferrimicrobiaceae bacterium]
MKAIQKAAFQGDMMLRRVAAVPPGLAEVSPENGRHILAHSETGHNHDVDANGLRLFAGDDPMVCYLRMEGVSEVDVLHHRSHDTHETVRLLGEPGTVWEVRRQREYTPDGWRRVED